MATEVKTVSVLDKYIQLKSLTWWASLIPLLAGAFLYLSGVIPGLDDLVAAVNVIYPNADAGLLLNMGLAGIGIRGALTQTAAAAAPTKTE